MCGIAGYIGKNKVDKDMFNHMVDIIEYRGPSDRGVYFDANIALGHRRLSIIDLSPAGHQPYEYLDRYVLVFNGEIYNYKELRLDLEIKGYQFKSSSDTEVLIACYDCYGEKCVELFNGMWAFAIYDKDEKEVFISRDRFGVKPLYYYKDENQFLFSSEIKQILCMLSPGQKVNRQRLFDYLIRGYSDFTEETMIEGIYQLRGGNNLRYCLENNKVCIEEYYNLNEIQTVCDDFNKAKDDFKKEFNNSISLRLRSDVPLGYCLSGGLDSSAIVCTADIVIKDNKIDVRQKSISSCFEDKRYDEQEYIDEVLKNTDVEGVKIFPQGDNLIEDLEKVIWHMDEPFSSTSQYAQWNVFKGARDNGLTVMLDGQGADEQLAGYTGFYSVIFAEYLRKLRLISFARELKAYKRLRAQTETYVKSYKIVVEAIISAFLPKKIQKIGKLYLFYLRRKSPFFAKDIKRTIMGLDLYPANNSRKYIIDNFKCNLSMLLRFEDRNSMAFSIESRVPFLDYKLVETVFKMPIEYKINNGITKHIVREALADVLPEKIRTRYSKLGFVTPEDQWINDNPEIYRKELEAAAQYLEPLVSKEKVLDWYDSIAGSVERMDYTAFRIICAGKWIKIFNLTV